MIRRVLPLLALATALAAPASSSAASIGLDRYRGAPTAEDGLAVSRPGDLGHLRWGVRLDVDYALNPLVLEAHSGSSSTEVGAVVEDHIVGRLTGTLGLFDRLVIYLGLPVNLMMSGTKFDEMPGPDGTVVGDLFLGLRGRFYGEPGDLFAFGAQATLTVPTAELANGGQRFGGDWTLGGDAMLLAELRWQWLVVTANLGGRFRRPATIASLEIGQELFWALGFTVPAIPGTLEAYLEFFGTTPFASFADRETSPVELLAGLRVWAQAGLNVGLAGGSGLGSRGYGSPDVRAVLTFGWAAP
jgi:hypothetical protein